MNRTHRDSPTKQSLVIRAATSEDIDELTRINRLCYPDLLRWRGPRFHTRKYWRTLLDAEYCELWVGVSNEVIGFFTFVLDEARYIETESRHHPNLLAALYMFVVCPKLFMKKALQKLKLCGMINLRRLFRSTFNESQIEASAIPRRLFETRTPWVGHIAVVPNMQRKGVGTEMLKFCIQRATDLGYKEIGAHRLRGNTNSIRLFEKFGFVTPYEGRKIVFYMKTLTEEVQS